jgi:hypothetical protein
MKAPISGNTREQENRDRRCKPRQACEFLQKSHGLFIDADQTLRAATFSPGAAASDLNQRQKARKGGR